jgi:hypothetical protein
MYMPTIKNPNRSGQPKKPLIEKKSQKFSVKFSLPEYYALKGRAKEAGLNRSEYIRQCFVRSEVRQRLSPGHLDHIRKLSGMANNLNQLAHRANRDGFALAARKCLRVMAAIDELIGRLGHDS